MAQLSGHMVVLGGGRGIRPPHTPPTPHHPYIKRMPTKSGYNDPPPIFLNGSNTVLPTVYYPLFLNWRGWTPILPHPGMGGRNWCRLGVILH